MVALISHRFWPMLASCLTGVNPRIEKNGGAKNNCRCQGQARQGGEPRFGAWGMHVAGRGKPAQGTGRLCRRRLQAAGLNPSRRSRKSGAGPHHTVVGVRSRGAVRRAGQRVVPGTEVRRIFSTTRGHQSAEDPHRILADGTAQRVNMPHPQK